MPRAHHDGTARRLAVRFNEPYYTFITNSNIISSKDLDAMTEPVQRKVYTNVYTSEFSLEDIPEPSRSQLEKAISAAGKVTMCGECSDIDE